MCSFKLYGDYFFKATLIQSQLNHTLIIPQALLICDRGIINGKLNLYVTMSRYMFRKDYFIFSLLWRLQDSYKDSHAKISGGKGILKRLRNFNRSGKKSYGAGRAKRGKRVSKQMPGKNILKIIIFNKRGTLMAHICKQWEVLANLRLTYRHCQPSTSLSISQIPRSCHFWIHLQVKGAILRLLCVLTSCQFDGRF